MADPLILAAPWLRGLIGLLLGAIAGSFLATIVVRWPAGRSIAQGRSQCDGCAAPLRAHELVPLLSYVMQAGRCRRCGRRIDRRHPAIELASGLIGAAALVALPGWAGLAGALFGWVLLALAVLDFEHLWLPDKLTLPLVGLGLAAGLAGAEPALTERVIGAAGGFLLLRWIAAGYRLLRGRTGLGGGDPKLFAAIGAWLGWRALPSVLLVASLMGIAVVLLLMLRGRKVEATSRLPFGLFLALAAWPVWLLEHVRLD
ncbi:prepilin peptidase [Sphingomonas oleivorans]|uniref:Prepilin leader peptidase/N-methyltransferase n=1 Tax=Sphingomonas oleivorans TaxID=1735121 RepID=A0A2T5FVN5_9SPHN|nr:A24 family peptidase [Sphingomonas oleivorans]PTQ09846.1 prepilin peptidase [Sphingomonas oleivorans]